MRVLQQIEFRLRLKKSFSFFGVYMKKFLPVMLFIALVFSCEEPLLPIPSNNLGISNDSNSSLEEGFSSPRNFSASQGLYRKISFSWDKVNKAVRYEIFAAKTPYDTFEKIKEVPASKLSCDITVKSNADNYYKIRAVNSSETVSAFSAIIRGTSLAQAVISDINTSNDDSSDVYWYMSNADAYKDDVCYTVICFDETQKEIARLNVDGSSSLLKATFENLKPNTNYLYQVEAFLDSNQNFIEKSEIVDAVTARRTRPDAPENLAGSEGIFKDKIELSFTLPNFVDVALGNKVYSKNPLYFKIYRRVKRSDTEEPASYEITCSYFGYKTTKAGGVSFTEEGLESDYVPGETVTFVDTNIERGVQYEYKVQSFADDAPREISSDTLCVAETVGHALSVVNLKQDLYEQVLNEEGTAYSQTNLSFSMLFDALGKDSLYTFALEEKRFLLESDNDGKEDTVGTLVGTYYFETIDEIHQFVRIFDLTEPLVIRGYYKYKLYILPKESNDVSEAFDATNLFGQILVTNDTSKPEIEGFVVKDGFADKFVLEWVYDATCSYRISYVPYNNDEAGEPVVIDQMPEDILSAATGETVTFVDTALSGDVREYSLQVIRGISVYSEPVLVKTLGTPSVYVDGKSYSSLELTWKPVQKATDYVLNFSYENFDKEGFPLPVVDGQVVDMRGILSYSFTADELEKDAEGNYTYQFENIPGYNNAELAGWPIHISLVAQNNEYSEEGDVLVQTVGNAVMPFMGPAKIGLSVSQMKSHNAIAVSWNAMDNADYYAIVRKNYMFNAEKKVAFDRSIVYIVDVAKNTLTLGEESLNDAVSLSFDANTNRYTVVDSAISLKDETSAWQKTQSRISWGLPYEYAVLPLLDSTDFDIDLTLDADTVTLGSDMLIGLSSIEKTGFAQGYGWNVQATKGWNFDLTESDDTKANNTHITITWETPCLDGLKNPQYKIFRRSVQNGIWSQIGASSICRYEDTFCDEGMVYEYAVGLTYSGTSSNPHEDNYYLNYLATSLDEKNYQLNAGYKLQKPKLSNNGVSRKDLGIGNVEVSWEASSLDGETNKGFDGYIVEVLNLDYASSLDDWKQVAEYSFANGISSDDILYTKLITADTQTLFKVLRNYKLYFRVRSFKENAEKKRTFSVPSEYKWEDGKEDEYVKWGVRQISDEELAKATMLALSYAFYRNDGGKEDYSNISSQFKYGKEGSVSGVTGTANFTDSSYVLDDPGKYKASYSFADYKASMLTPSGGVSTGFVSLTSSSQSFKIKGLLDHYIYTFLDTHSITVACEYGEIKSNATVTFEASDKNTLKLSVTRDETEKTIVNTSDNETRKKWFPMQIHSDTSYLLNNASYGWWN